MILTWIDFCSELAVSVVQMALDYRDSNVQLRLADAISIARTSVSRSVEREEEILSWSICVSRDMEVIKSVSERAEDYSSLWLWRSIEDFCNLLE